ncbi:putative ethylene-responsive binding factor-associated repression, Ninja family [Helianthus annuus]|nr:putative ethylene-responsive binding factor-associated repression, Ninja family [Helianthus annuus]KAJ0506685.1 putative ethylene-responsive binding factor-associated repression, Ninja family [Helianthus annuus]KAJ0679576.1 putative ethylene-responsive binding factor-associated repression, Ninja family [Helianthus annuus]KAJ0868171.1 putative ethylene-responsive binding factor-associated repression, Ninja family [Helianthus annuus]
MGDPKTNNEKGNLSLDLKRTFSQDLLQRFTGSGDPKGSDPEQEVELNLGLSLGGRFGVDKSKLVRSSSIATILPVVKDDDVLLTGKEKTGPGGSYSGLVRTSSLPVETEEEWRKRKELQSLRRLAAKRRRSEKQKNLNRVEREEYVAAMGRVGSSIGPGFGSGKWEFGGPVATSDGTGAGLTRGSVESQASSVSEFESRQLPGSSTEGEVSPASVQSRQERTNQDATNSSQSKAGEPAVGPSRPKTENSPNNKGKEIRSSSVDMPCVFTQGDGPGGRRIDGILYKYGKGEEVKIMCVCHGSFLTPAEFVKHAGGTDVDHPLKHIVVNPNSSSYL